METLLQVQNLHIRFHGTNRDHSAVNGISFSLSPGEILGLVGESGSGKTLTAMSISGLLPRRKAEVKGSITLEGREILQCSPAQLRRVQGRDISVIFQEPMTSLNPLMRIGAQVEESLRVHFSLSSKERKNRALEAMTQVELPNPEALYRRYPHELSGGMLQRVMIAAAIVSRPKLLLADEPTTALDVSIQAQILDLLKRLNEETGMAILFISHNLHLVQKLCQRVAVMQRGTLVETGPTASLFESPQQDYTKQLLAAIPTRDRKLI